MIAEAANYIATLAVSGRKSPAEINASIRLWARARRCGADWAEHEARSKAAMRDVMDGLTRFNTAVILGSGLLRDVPIEAIAERFQRVVLVDLQHLASVRLWTRLKGMANISFVERDVSGLAEMANGVVAEIDPLDFLSAYGEIDLLVSANLLSQLALGATRRLKAEEGIPALIGLHIAALGKHAGASCLITDISYEIIDKAGKVHERRDLMHGVDLPGVKDRWSWTVAPFGEIVAGFKAVHEVICATIVNRR